MSLETAIVELTDNIKTLIETLKHPSVESSPVETSATSDEKPSGRGKNKGKGKDNAEDEVTIDDIRVILKDVIDAGGKDDVGKLLKKYKAVKLQDTKESDYPAIKEAAEALREKHTSEASSEDELL